MRASERRSASGGAFGYAKKARKAFGRRKIKESVDNRLVEKVLKMKRIINEMKLRLPAKSINESVARSVICAFSAELDPTLEELGDLRCAVSEAVTNCIVHAYPDGYGMITLRCRMLKDNVLDIVIKDKGVGIPDLEQARRPTFTTGGSERSGMGFTIMESFMTSFEVTSQPGKGTSIHMRRKIKQRQ